MGVPLLFLKGSHIIEFGPGGGYNAVATSFFAPQRYDFVDASQKSIDELNRKKNNNEFNASVMNIYESEFLKFSSHQEYISFILK